MADKDTKRPARIALKVGPAIKQGARIILPVGAGGLASVVGGSIARRIDAVASFADTPIKAAVVDAAAGSLLSSIGLMVFAKITTTKRAISLAPFVFAGAIGVPVMRAAAPMVVDTVMRAVDGLMSFGSPAPAPAVGAAPAGRFLPAGAYANMNAGLQGLLPPAGAYANLDAGLQGRLPAGWGDVGGPNFGPGNMAANRLPAGLIRL